MFKLFVNELECIRIIVGGVDGLAGGAGGGGAAHEEGDGSISVL